MVTSLAVFVGHGFVLSFVYPKVMEQALTMGGLVDLTNNMIN